MGQFWRRTGEWCGGSAIFIEASQIARQPCPACGKVVRVHANGRVNAHFPATLVVHKRRGEQTTDLGAED
jgi:hypothetical protein